MCTQWTVLQSSNNITINHVDDNKEVYSSVERFKIYDVSRTSPVETIVYEFNILLQLPQTSQAQQYKITVRMNSRAAALLKMEEGNEPPSWWHYFNPPILIIEIEYVDYVVARNMLSMLETWIAQVEVGANPKVLNWFQEHSHRVPEIFKFCLVILVGFTFFTVAPTVLIPGSDPAKLAKFVIIALIGSWICAEVAACSEKLWRKALTDSRI